MKSPIRVRRCFAYIVLACWIAMTLLIVGGEIAKNHANFINVHEGVFHAKPQSNNLDQLNAETKAWEKVTEFNEWYNSESKAEIKVWFVLTLLGATLFAERKQPQLLKPTD